MEPERDLIIIGGGAAGLTAAQYGARANLSVLLIEEMATGGQALIIDDLENYPGFPEPIKGFQFVERMEQQTVKFGGEIKYATVTRIAKQNRIFEVETSEGTFTAYTIIFATGAKHRLLGVPGEGEFTGKGVSYCATCDGPFFKNKRILVVGGGDSACDESMFLSKLTDKLIVAHRRDRFRAQKGLAERLMRTKNVEIRFNTIVKEIKGSAKVESVLFENVETGETYTEPMDAVFVFIGSIPQTDLVPEIKKDEGGYIVANECMETSIPGLYVAGDVRATPFRQLVVSASDGAIAAHCASQYIDDLKGEAYN